MRAIFISYRREDAEGQAGRLFDDLVAHFGNDSVFMDVAGLEPGRDFRRAIDQQVSSCGVLLALIGKDWLDAKNASGNDGSMIRWISFASETASALKRDIPVVPVLVRGASMPRVEDLPADLKDLAFRNAGVDARSLGFRCTGVGKGAGALRSSGSKVHAARVRSPPSSVFTRIPSARS